ncbi:glycosyltransferase family 2 protein [Marinobacter sp.]|uniref:glycosyltransferase family 2 protein n=1 Tax=Marinobacter sp. TaxID=50741 RepID=UPI0034A25A79
MKYKISVVIPAKNEADNLKRLLSELMGMSEFHEVIVVNDGSTDNSSQVIRQSGATLVNHQVSKGNGAAIKSGVRAATGDILVLMDGDGQHQALDIGRLLNRLDEGFDMVVGTRDNDGQAGFGRQLANGFYNRLASYMTGQRVEDLTSGFRAVWRNKFIKFLSLLPNGFSYPTTSTMAFFRAGYSVAYEPVQVLKRQGKSHIKPLKDGLRFLLIIFKIGTLYSPLKLFVPISFSIFLLGLGYYGYTYSSAGRFTNMSALMFTTSLIIFLVGLVSEQITALLYKDTEE